MISLALLPDGNLRASFFGDNDDLEEFIDNIEGMGHDGAFIVATENYWANGWGVYASNEIAMFTGIIICDDASHDDDGEPELFGKVWANMTGQISSATQDILDFGECIFTRVEDESDS